MRDKFDLIRLKKKKFLRTYYKHSGVLNNCILARNSAVFLRWSLGVSHVPRHARWTSKGGYTRGRGLVLGCCIERIGHRPWNNESLRSYGSMPLFCSPNTILTAKASPNRRSIRELRLQRFDKIPSVRPGERYLLNCENQRPSDRARNREPRPLNSALRKAFIRGCPCAIAAPSSQCNGVQ